MYWVSDILQTEQKFLSSLQIKLLENVGLDKEGEKWTHGRQENANKTGLKNWQ